MVTCWWRDDGGRPIATYRLHQPVPHAHGIVPCIELAAPKPGRSHQAGLNISNWWCLR